MSVFSYATEKSGNDMAGSIIPNCLMSGQTLCCIQGHCCIEGHFPLGRSARLQVLPVSFSSLYSNNSIQNLEGGYGLRLVNSLKPPPLPAQPFNP